MADHQLALFNAAVSDMPMESERMTGFVARLAPVFALAEASPGFVWRIPDDETRTTPLRIPPDEAAALQAVGKHLIVNLSVWRDLASVEAFVYRSAHAETMRRGHEWFQPLPGGPLVLWWVRAGERPTFESALRKLLGLHANGPGPDAFTFRRPFPPPSVDTSIDAVAE